MTLPAIQTNLTARQYPYRIEDMPAGAPRRRTAGEAARLAVRRVWRRRSSRRVGLDGRPLLARVLKSGTRRAHSRVIFAVLVVHT
jgi:hypothetical protein